MEAKKVHGAEEVLPIRILIVDDSDEIRAMFKMICAKINGVKIDEAVNGEDALDKVEQFSPHLVLMDIMMPVMDGFEATKLIKERYPSIVVVVVTALIDEDVERRLRRIGAAGYLHKPITDPKLTRVRIASFVSYLRVTHGANGTILSQRTSANPFNSSIRVIRTTAAIASGDDMMDFNIWLTERYMVGHRMQDSIYRLETSLLIDVVSASLKQHIPVTIWVEESFEEIYLGVSVMTGIDMSKLYDDYALILKHDRFVRIDESWLYIRLSLREDKSPAIEEANAKVAAATVKTDPKPADKPVADTQPTAATAKSVRTIDAAEAQMLRHSEVEKLSAVAYCDGLNEGDLYEVQDMHDVEDEWMQILGDLDEEFSIAVFRRLGSSMMSYSTVVKKFFEFDTLSYALVAMSKLVSEIGEDAANRVSPPLLITLMRGMLDDMKKWRDTIFISRSTLDIHYLDASLLSSCMQIESMLLNSNVKVGDDDDDNDLELF